jgi:uncharacterized damage-inducible protein DinB
MAMSPIALLLDVLDGAFVRGWQGTTLTGSLRGVSAAVARRRPGSGRHNIWEEVLHAAYWKYTVRRRLTGEQGGRFPRGPRNWPALPSRPTAVAWRDDLALLRETHRELRETVAALSPGQLSRRRGRWTVAEAVYGIAAHDVYHTGQIQLIKRLVA